MKINAKLHCGIKALIELAKSSDPNGLRQKDIALKQDISVKFLDQIVNSLKVAGLIYRIGGKKSGGYKLTKDPSEITIYDIYKAFEPELNINPCLLDSTICQRSPTCGAHCFLSEFNLEMKNFMLSHTLHGLIDLEVAKELELENS
ncbi:MAG: Rrf2 family transcriptional regulator [Bacteroidota bacterium]|nr:Rrf2 family transcriptional regulator [Bacteroidota bacterium]